MKRGLVLGKFLPYHRGHAHLINSARAQVDELTVLVCSIAAEPIPGGVRFQWVRESHPDCRVVHVNEEVPQAPEDGAEFWPIWRDLVARYAGNVDMVFTSEAYGDELARQLGATHTCVDISRIRIPVSGTAIRTDPMRNWEYIPPVARPWFVRRIAIVGAESTGKTTLAEQLAEHFETVWVPEYGRSYCEGKDASRLLLADFEAIAWGQATWEDDAAYRANRVLICDTELHTTCTWSELITGTQPPWLTGAARSRNYDLVLMLGADVPWVDDGTRVLEQRRQEHTELLRRELHSARRSVITLEGTYEERLEAAIDAVRRVIATSTVSNSHSAESRSP